MLRVSPTMLSRLTLLSVLVCIADLFRVTWKLSSWCVCLCVNRHVVEMLRLKKRNFSPRSFVYWAFYAAVFLILPAGWWASGEIRGNGWHLWKWMKFDRIWRSCRKFGKHGVNADVVIQRYLCNLHWTTKDQLLKERLPFIWRIWQLW